MALQKDADYSKEVKMAYGLIAFIIIVIFASLVWFYSLVTAFASIHKLQQSSYRNKRLLRRLFEKQSGVYSEKIFFSILAMSLLLAITTIIKLIISPHSFDFLSVLNLILFLLICIDTIIFDVKKIKSFKHQKKPLVFTARAKRIISASFILITIIVILYIVRSFLTDLSLIIYFLPVILLFTPFIVMLANLIMLPTETLIRNGYIKDAIRIRDSRDDLRVIGITGSYGKTSTKNIIHKILSQKYLSLHTPSSYNTEMGITITIRTMLKRIHQVLVVEMGARQKGDIKKCCSIAKPNYAVLTIVGEAHLETFKTKKNIKNTKAELVRYLDEDGTAFMNADDSNTYDILPGIKAKKVLFGIESDNTNVKATDIKTSPEGCEFAVLITPPLSTDERKIQFKTKLLGEHNIYNILAGISIGIVFGVPMEAIKYAVSILEPIEHRLQIKKNKGLTIIDDSFNSNPTGFKEAVNVLSTFDEKYRKIIITPGMVELGKEEYQRNKEAGSHIGKHCDYVILVGENRANPLLEGLSEVEFDGNKIYVADSLKDATTHLYSIARNNDVVLFENDLPDVYGG